MNFQNILRFQPVDLRTLIFALTGANYNDFWKISIITYIIDDL